MKKSKKDRSPVSKKRRTVICTTILFLSMMLIFTYGKEIAFISIIAHNQFIKPDEAKMERVFERDKDILENVSVAMLGADEDLYIGGMFANTDLSGDVDHLDEDIIKSAKELINNKGYSVISKIDNEVHFQYWENMDEGRGFIYCMHEDIPRTMEFLVYSKALGDNWYYYEDSFNRWKVQNRME